MSSDNLQPDAYAPLVRAALAEDAGPGDATTLATIPEGLRASARLNAREELIACGLPIAIFVFLQISTEVEAVCHAAEGQLVQPGGTLLTLRGPARALLTGERTALNFVQRLSGVATLTHRYAEQLRGTKARLLDTRKTTPGWRQLEKYAVRTGGGHNHRQGLFDLILIKDNHLAALREAKPNAIAAAVERARAAYPALKVEVEADRLEQVEQALAAGADIILLDNMSLEDLRAAVNLTRGRCLTEASGGINLKTIRGVAETGVDYISVGALTHSAQAVDIGLDFELGS